MKAQTALDLTSYNLRWQLRQCLTRHVATTTRDEHFREHAKQTLHRALSLHAHTPSSSSSAATRVTCLPHDQQRAQTGRTSKRLMRVALISGKSSCFSSPLAMPLATSRHESCLSSFRMRGGWLTAALGKTLLWNSSLVYLEGGCRDKRHEQKTAP